MRSPSEVCPWGHRPIRRIGWPEDGGRRDGGKEGRKGGGVGDGWMGRRDRGMKWGKEYGDEKVGVGMMGGTRQREKVTFGKGVYA